VGAAIAEGSHDEKGICALLVQADTTIKPTMKSEYHIPVLDKYKYVQLPYPSSKEIDTKRPTSPSRFVIAVIIPALYDFLLW